MVFMKVLCQLESIESGSENDEKSRKPAIGGNSLLLLEIPVSISHEETLGTL